MATISGTEFKKLDPGPWFWWIAEDMTYNSFTYTPGLNIYPKKLNPRRISEPRGFYLIDNIKNLTKFYGYGPVLGIFDIPDDAQVYLRRNNKFKSDKVILLETTASETDLIDYFKKARENGFYWHSRVCGYAAENGHLEVLKWARENGCPWNSDTCAYAAGNNHLEILKWAKENGCPWDSRVFSYAAGNGHLEVLKYAHENGCPWDSDACSYAAGNGHLEVLKWLRENGCPWDSRTCAYAAADGHLEVLKWAKENGCPTE